ncbi:MAG: inositol monophosphatase family protein [Chloroflexota bacterium]
MIANSLAVRQHAVQLAREAGALLMDRFEEPHEIKHKSSVFDVATEADRAAEDLIVSSLRASYPDHHIMGEEGGGYGAPVEEAEYHWYIDPLDGTTNFAGNIPHFCVSIALADKNNQPLIGVIYDPNSDELFSAVQGEGAILNDRPISVSEVDRLDSAVLAAGFPYAKRGKDSDDYRQFTYFAPRTRGMRRFGSAALELCWVASGRFEAYWEWGLSRWDFYAGMLIVQEAGGMMTDFVGQQSERFYNGRQVLATNKNLHETIVTSMQNVLHPA